MKIANAKHIKKEQQEHAQQQRRLDAVPSCLDSNRTVGDGCALGEGETLVLTEDFVCENQTDNGACIELRGDNTRINLNGFSIVKDSTSTDPFPLGAISINNFSSGDGGISTGAVIENGSIIGDFPTHIATRNPSGNIQPVSDLTIRGMTFDGFANYGVLLAGLVTGSKILGSTFKNGPSPTAGAIVGFEEASTTAAQIRIEESVNTLVQNNEFQVACPGQSNFAGVLAVDSKNSYINGNNILLNNGAAFTSGTDPSLANSGCRGIAFESVSDSNTGNIIDNMVTGVMDSGHGIFVAGDDRRGPFYLASNVLTDLQNAIVLDEVRDLFVENNSISGSDVGVRILNAISAEDNVSVDNNMFCGNKVGVLNVVTPVPVAEMCPSGKSGKKGGAKSGKSGKGGAKSGMSGTCSCPAGSAKGSKSRRLKGSSKGSKKANKGVRGPGFSIGIASDILLGNGDLRFVQNDGALFTTSGATNGGFESFFGECDVPLSANVPQTCPLTIGYKDGTKLAMTCISSSGIYSDLYGCKVTGDYLNGAEASLQQDFGGSSLLFSLTVLGGCVC